MYIQEFTIIIISNFKLIAFNRMLIAVTPQPLWWHISMKILHPLLINSKPPKQNDPTSLHSSVIAPDLLKFPRLHSNRIPIVFHYPFKIKSSHYQSTCEGSWLFFNWLDYQVWMGPPLLVPRPRFIQVPATEQGARLNTAAGVSSI